MSTRSSEEAMGFDEIPGAEPDGVRMLSNPVLIARWVLALAACYAVLFHTSDGLVPELKQNFVAGVLGFTLLATWALHKKPSKLLRMMVSLIDIAIVSGAIVIVENASTEFFLVYLVVVTFAAQSLGPVAAGGHSLLVALVYGGLLYRELGEAVFTSPEYLIRLGFLCGLGFIFAVVGDEAKRQKRRAQTIAARMQSVAVHARSLARDKYRLRALSEIGRLGLVGAAAADSDVLFEISKRVQKGVGVDRCSLVVFSGDDATGYVAASSDDAAIEVRPIKIKQYPELQETLAHGEITEFRRGDPKEIWSKVADFLPNVSSFNSFLVVPIKANEQVFGAFYLRDRKAGRVFDEEERDFCWASALMTASFIRGRGLLQQLRQQSRIDGLTGLLNFQAFTEEAQNTLSAPNALTVAPFTLAVIDMDNLKEVNDQHGHMAGNRAITEMGDRLRAALPDALAMCRYGGDEFVALVHGSRESAVERLTEMLNQLSGLQWDAPFVVRASIGIAEFPVNGSALEQLLESADQAMYLAKGSGGHRIRSADCDQDEGELYEAVVQVQTRRIVPAAIETFNEQLGELQRRSILGLKAPVVRESIAALMESVELIDPHSKEHSTEVSRLCGRLAAALRMPQEHSLMVEIGGHLHDVGKIKLPPEILTKSDELSAEERAVIQQVPVEGANILASLPGLREVAEIVLGHQERWDGSGYPRGLAGDDIPVGAQIVGICDVYNALVSERAQRPALDVRRASALIEQEIGRLWNPQLARVFLDLLAQEDPDAVVGENNARDTPDVQAANG